MKQNITIESVGNLLLYYRSDLAYIRAFQDCKLHRGDHLVSFLYATLPRFLAEYKVARCIKKGRQPDFLKTVISHVNAGGAEADDVDILAMRLEKLGVTHKGETMVSLVSKILFLNRPWKVLPYDKLVRNVIGYSGTVYSDCLKAVKKKKKPILKLYDALPKSIMAYLQLIEAKVVPNMRHVDGIRKMRFIDKVLWTIGRNKLDLTCIE